MSLEVFLTEFYKEYDEITDETSKLTKCEGTSVTEEKLKLSSAYEALSNRTIALQKYLTENTKFIPIYETRKAQEYLARLSKLSQEKRDEIFPKKKFGFKSKQKMTSLEQAINKSENNESDLQNKSAKQDSDSIFFKDSSCTIKDIDGLTMIKNDHEINGKDIGLLNINNAFIKLYGNPSVLHAKNIKNSVILCGPISGSAFVNNLNNVKLVIACHQLRIHESYDSDFYIHLGSRAIIEDCSRVTFSPYALSYPSLKKHFEQSSLNMNESNWECIDDFNWLNEAKSPNWNFLDANKRTSWKTDDNGEKTQ